MSQTQGQPVHGVLRHAVALTLAIAERRIFDEVHRRKRDGRIPVEVIDPGGEVIQPQVTFQQRHDAINRPLVAAAADAQHAFLRAQAEAVLGKSRGVRSADQDVALAGRHIMQQGQCRTGRFADESLQQLRGREIGGSLLCHDDPGRRFAVAGQPGLRPDSGRPKQNISLRFKDNFSSRCTKKRSTKCSSGVVIKVVTSAIMTKITKIDGGRTPIS